MTSGSNDDAGRSRGLRSADDTANGGGSLRALVLLRHGQSTANAGDTFSGWMDVALTARGEREALRAAELLASAGFVPGVVHTSLLRRSTHTAELVLAALDRSWLPVARSWRLNERHYGALQGRRRADVLAEVGEETFMRWRRSYDERPPVEDRHASAELQADARYRLLPTNALPNAESLADVARRVLPYWQDIVAADVAAGRVPLVVAHGNSLRALCMILDQLSPAEVEGLNIPTGVPLVYDLDGQWRPRVRGGVYLDPEAAAVGATEVAAQGRRG